MTAAAVFAFFLPNIRAEARRMIAMQHGAVGITAQAAVASALEVESAER